MTGGDLDAAASLEVVDGEVDLGGVDHADVDDVGAGGVHAGDECLGYRWAMGAHVTTDDEGLGVGFAALNALEE